MQGEHLLTQTKQGGDFLDIVLNKSALDHRTRWIRNDLHTCQHLSQKRFCIREVYATERPQPNGVVDTLAALKAHRRELIDPKNKRPW